MLCRPIFEYTLSPFNYVSSVWIRLKRSSRQCFCHFVTASLINRFVPVENLLSVSGR